nr:NAD-binding protein [Lautropia sp.]
MTTILQPASTRAVVVGGGTMGADIAVVLARARCRATVIESSDARRAQLDQHLS